MIDKSTLKEHSTYQGMFYYKKPNRRWSKDFFSISWAIENQRREMDIVELLKKSGYGVVEGKDAVLKKIDKLAEKSTPSTANRMPLRAI